MTAAVWMAVPPEVHSALLSQGPGPGPLMAAASAWQALAVEYAAAADEIKALMAATRASWEGSGVQAWAAAHEPYLAWLSQSSSDSLVAAAQHEVAAIAYSAALAAMPTLPELAANHAIHAALVATNFLGINAIPIALNEADYVRMWVQAATTMTAYEASSAAAVTSMPPSSPAPQILRATAQAPAASLDPVRMALNALEPILNSFGVNPLIRNPLVSNVVTSFIADVLENFGIYWDPAAGMLNGLDYEYYADATQPMWYLARGLELIGDSMQMTQNPTQAIQYMLALAIFDWPTHIAQFGTAISQSPLLLAAAGGALMLPAASAGGLAGLAGLATAPQPAAAPAPQTGPAATGSWPTAAMTAHPPGLATAPASAPAPTAPPAPASTPAAAGPVSPTVGAGFTPPYAVGPPGIGFGSGMSTSASATAKKKAPEPDGASAAAQSSAASRRRARALQRKRITERQYGDEFMDMEVEVEPDWDEPPGTAASHQGAHRLGLAGTVNKENVTEATGLATLNDDDFGGGPTTPMLPSTWR